MAVIASVLLISAGPASAGVSGKYELSWDIVATEVPAEPFWVKEQGEVVSTRLRPRGLFAPEADVVDAAGALLVPRDTQMVLVNGPYPMACNVNKAAAGKAKSNRVCVLDSDRDGAVDTAFSQGMGGDYWMSLEGELSERKLVSVKPVELATLDPAEMTDAPYLSFHYQRILDGGIQIPLTQEGGDMVRFHFKVGREKRREWMVRECREATLPSQCASSAFPSVLSIAGLELELLERRKEDVRMRILRPFGGRSVKFVEIHDGYNSGSLLYAELPGA
ncbi:hypothetical protein [Parerythrobacter lacustris]|uniref:Uncharacterized protein n=1 Tax=Parerythrobacter lacustris TaxID=2969984 RepID=A0ABT1XTP5_9SPHN|nr:hypothetical protein [Parerythrobacter lacustris]MCR2835013.1 hypothetical protein [Parerythrobacter lacustris]